MQPWPLLDRWTAPGCIHTSTAGGSSCHTAACMHCWHCQLMNDGCVHIHVCQGAHPSWCFVQECPAVCCGGYGHAGRHGVLMHARWRARAGQHGSEQAAGASVQFCMHACMCQAGKILQLQCQRGNSTWRVERSSHKLHADLHGWWQPAIRCGTAFALPTTQLMQHTQLWEHMTHRTAAGGCCNA